MSRMIKWLLLTFFLCALFGTETKAQCVTGLNANEVQAAINTASEGGTVTVPAGICTWTTGVTISGKGIKVQGAGAGRIIAISSSTLAIGTGSKTMSVLGTNIVCSPTCNTGAPSISAGQTLNFAETGNTQNKMTGTVTSFDSGTGSLVMNITSAAGTCGNVTLSNCARWLISTPSSTILINNSSSPLFTITEDTAFNTSLSGIRFQEGTAATHIFRQYASGGMAILIHDNWFEETTPTQVMIDSNTNRGVIWNNSFDSSPYSASPDAIRIKGAPSTSWTTPSTMGTADITGLNNLYVENNDFHALFGGSDFDDNARAVWRYNLMNNVAISTHGADSSQTGNRHFEIYNNRFIYNGYSNGKSFNIGNGWIYVRGGTFLVYNNNMDAISSADYTKADVEMLEFNIRFAGSADPTDACWGAGTSNGALYHAPRQVGMGYVTGTGTDGKGRTKDAFNYVGDSEPVYIWGNSRSPLSISIMDYNPSQCTSPDTDANYIVQNRDFFNGTTAKPGWSPYTYPHPLRQGSGVPPASSPAPPSNLAAVVQ